MSAMSTPSPSSTLERLLRRRVVDDRHLLVQLAVDPARPGHAQLAVARGSAPRRACRPGCAAAPGSSAGWCRCRRARYGPRSSVSGAPLSRSIDGRQDARVELVETEAATVDPDVAARVGQQVQVAVLGDLDVAEVRRRDDRSVAGVRCSSVAGRRSCGDRLPSRCRQATRRGEHRAVDGLVAVGHPRGREPLEHGRR